MHLMVSSYRINLDTRGIISFASQLLCPNHYGVYIFQQLRQNPRSRADLAEVEAAAEEEILFLYFC